MALTSGTRLGPYEIQSQLGAGGMGEVYRAIDTRLGREVALKILPESFASDATRLRRFEQEIKVLSALNHPNILAMYDVGEASRVHYFITELLEGRELRDRLTVGGLPPRKAVEFAMQIARGLAAAHERGVVHRDLKPENVYITNDGRLKLLDFGLAKPLALAALAKSAATVSIASDAGTVLGTVGYMSPEQVRGGIADERSDIFSFGVVLYEMIRGKRPFSADSSVEVMNAILKDDPPEAPAGTVPPALDRIIRRCLEKNPEERFQSARDLAFALEAISAPSSASGASLALPVRKGRLWWFAAAGLAVMATAAGVYLGVKIRRPPSYTLMTFDSGYAGPARFSRDGNTLIYSAAWGGSAERLYSQRAKARDAVSMNVDAQVVGVADTGDMAVILNRHFLASWLQVGTLARLPIEGGTPRPILEDVYSADLARDGKEFAVVRSVGGKQRLEYPIGKVLFETQGWIASIRISPDGNTVAFINHPILVDDAGGIDIVNRNGEHRVLTEEYASAHTLTWSPDGREVWYSATPTGEEDSIWATTLAGKVRVVASAPIEMDIQDISDSGRVLLESIRYSVELGIKRASAMNARPLNAGIIELTSVSRDGEWVAYTRMGEAKNEVYLQRTDGGPPVKIGEGFGVGISYDGQTIGAINPEDAHKLILYPAGTGEQREINLGELRAQVLNRENSVTFSRDGKLALLSAFNSKGELRDYLVNLSTASVRPATPIGSGGGKLSPDGTRVLTTELATNKHMIVEIDSQKEIELRGLGAHEDVIGWTEAGNSLVIWNQEVPARVWILDSANGQRRFVQTVDALANLGTMYAKMVTNTNGTVAVYRLRRGMYTLYLADGLK